MFYNQKDVLKVYYIVAVDNYQHFHSVHYRNKHGYMQTISKNTGLVLDSLRFYFPKIVFPTVRVTLDTKLPNRSHFFSCNKIHIFITSDA